MPGQFCPANFDDDDITADITQWLSMTQVGHELGIENPVTARAYANKLRNKGEFPHATHIPIPWGNKRQYIIPPEDLEEYQLKRQQDQMDREIHREMNRRPS